MKISLEMIKKLREATDAGVADCRQALEESNGDMEKAKAWIRAKGISRAEKKGEREVKAGAVFTYTHHTGRVGVLVALGCETDFVAKTEHFQKLGKELALHVAAARPETVAELLEQDYVRDASKKISELIKETIGVLGENIQVVDFKIVAI